MKSLLFAVLLAVTASTAHAQGYNPMQPNYWAGPSIGDFNRAGIYFGSTQRRYGRNSSYGNYYNDGFYQRQNLYELRRLRIAVEDANFQRRTRGW